MARIYHDPHFPFTTCNGTCAAVDLQIFCRDDSRVIVVASDLLGADDQPLGVVTGGIDAIATRVANELGYAFDYLIQHYPLSRRGIPVPVQQGQRSLAESFDLVMLQWDHGARCYHAVSTKETWPWKHLDRQTAEAIIGESFFVDYVPA